MPARQQDIAIRYLLSVVDRGVNQAIRSTRELGTTATKSQAQVDTALRAVQTQYAALERIAVKADDQIAKSAVTASATVNKALDGQVAKLRETGASYSSIIAKQSELRASSGELAASIERNSRREIAAMQAARAEADRGIRQRLSGLGGRASGALAGAAAGVGSAAFGGLAIGGGLAIAGLEKSRGITEGMLAIRGATHLPTNQALALATIATSLGIAPRSIGQGFGTLGGQVTRALGGSKASVEAFQALGITQAQAQANVNNPLALFDLVTQRTARLPATQAAAVQRQLLGRGSQIVGQLTAGGTLSAQVAGVQRDIPGINPEKLVKMQEAFIRLKEVTTAFELSFAQAFGPAIGKGLQAIIPLLKPIATGFQDAFGAIKGFVQGPVGQAIGQFGSMVFDAGKKLVEAFKPAEPLFRNVLLPLLKGVAIGVGLGLIGALKLATEAVKLFAPALGALGNLLAPLKDGFAAVGTVIGTFFSGGLFAKMAQGIGAVVGEIPLLGKAFDLLLKPIELVGKGIESLYRIMGDTFAKIFGLIPGVGSKMAALFGDVASGIVGVFSGIGDGILGLLGAAWNGIASALQAVIDGIWSADVLGVLPSKPRIPMFGSTSMPSAASAGSRKNTAGAVVGGPHSRHAAGGWVPGDPHRDGTLAMLSGNEFVMTGHGQQMLDSYAPGLLDHIASSQLPHFASGGWTVKSGTGRTAKPRMRYYKHQPVGVMNEAEWQHYQATHGSKHAGLNQSWKTIGATTYDDSGATSSGKHYPHGFAELAPAGISSSQVNFGNATLLGHLAYGERLLARKGPGSPVVEAAKDDIGRGQQNNFYKLDMGRSLAAALGIHGQYKGAIQIASTQPGVPLSALGSGSTQTPTLQNAIAQLTTGSAFAGGYQAGLGGNTLMDTVRSGVLATLIGDVAVTKSGLIGDNGATPGSMSGGGGSLGAMASAASAIASHRYPYKWGGGHNNSFTGPYDCSGAVSAVLHAGGALNSPLTSGQLMRWGQPGRGKHVSVWAGPKHTFMGINGRYFGTSTMNPGGGANWIPRFPENLPAVRHPPGLRTGGFLPRFRRGGRASTPAPLRMFNSLIGQDDSADVSGILTLLARELDNVTRYTTDKLEQLLNRLKHHSRKGLDAIQVRRMDTAIRLIDAAIGNRVGMAVEAAQAQLDKLGRDKHHLAAAQTAFGVDTGSPEAIKQITAIDVQIQQGYQSQVGVLQAALAKARKHGDKASIKDLTDKLNTALGNLDDAAAQVLVDIRAGIEAATQQVVDKADFAVQVAQAGESNLGIQQQIAGSQGTTAGGAQLSQYINTQVIPALRAELDAVNKDAEAAASVGDTVRWRADVLKALGIQGQIGQETLNATQSVAKNTAPLAQFGGQLAFQFHGEQFTDRSLVGFGVGT